MNLGGVQTGTVTLIRCPRCDSPVGIRAGLVLRILSEDRRRSWCHELVEPSTGIVVDKGGEF